VNAPSVASPRGPLRTVLLALIVTALDAMLLAIALGGVSALLHHARALALVGLWGASSIVLGLLHPVREQDVVDRTPDAPLVLVALFLIPLLTPPLSATGERFGWLPLPGGETLRWSGVALSGVGLWLRIAAMAQLGARFSPVAAIQRTHTLETRGLYARVRHPGYLGSALANLGAVLAFGSAVGLAGVALMAWMLALRVAREEALLARRFGEDYARYRSRTGALIPRLLPPRGA
jgi:protein-S-isoprenylcysteine O-methyltransferase Ste14